MTPHIPRRNDGYTNPHPHQSNASVLPAPELSQQIGVLGVNLPSHRPRDAQAQRNQGIRDGQEERGGDALMFLWHRAAEAPRTGSIIPRTR